MTEVGNASYQEAEAEAVHHSKSEGSWQLSKILSQNELRKLVCRLVYANLTKPRVIRDREKKKTSIETIPP